MSVDLTSILGTLNRSILAEAVHRAMRTINYRDGADNMIAGLQQDAPADEAAKAALVTLRSIEHEENRPISDLSDDLPRSREGDEHVAINKVGAAVPVG